MASHRGYSNLLGQRLRGSDGRSLGRVDGILHRPDGTVWALVLRRRGLRRTTMAVLLEQPLPAQTAAPQRVEWPFPAQSAAGGGADV